MRIINKKFLIQAEKKFPKAAKYLRSWRIVVEAATWKSLAEVRKTYSNADAVRVASGRTIVVFNVCGNSYRLLVALHYNRQIAYTLRFLTHAEYSQAQWKEEL